MKLHPWPLEGAQSELRPADDATVAVLSDYPSFGKNGDAGSPFSAPTYALRIHGRLPEGTVAAFYVGNESEIAFAAVDVERHWLVSDPLPTISFVDQLVEALGDAGPSQLVPPVIRASKVRIALLWGRGGTDEFDTLLGDGESLADWREVLGSSEAVELSVGPIPRGSAEPWSRLLLIGPRSRRVAVVPALDDPGMVVLTQLSHDVVRSILETALRGRDDADFSSARAAWAVAAQEVRS